MCVVFVRVGLFFLLLMDTSMYGTNTLRCCFSMFYNVVLYIHFVYIIITTLLKLSFHETYQDIYNSV